MHLFRTSQQTFSLLAHSVVVLAGADSLVCNTFLTGCHLTKVFFLSSSENDGTNYFLVHQIVRLFSSNPDALGNETNAVVMLNRSDVTSNYLKSNLDFFSFFFSESIFFCIAVYSVYEKGANYLVFKYYRNLSRFHSAEVFFSPFPSVSLLQLYFLSSGGWLDKSQQVKNETSASPDFEYH